MHTATCSVTALNEQFIAAHQLLQWPTSSKCTPRSRHPCRAQSGIPGVHPGRSVSSEWVSQSHNSPETEATCRKRTLLAGAAVAAGGQLLHPLIYPPPAEAALVQFPCAELKNKYILVRHEVHGACIQCRWWCRNWESDLIGPLYTT